jgi:septal ring-binding cell division protein DamX
MGGLSSLASLGLNVALGQEAARRESKDLKKERDRQLAAIMRDNQEAERQQANALRRRQASERARAGATGTATTGGSIDAILRGLEREAELDGASRRAATSARVQQIRDSFGTRRRNNLLTTTNRLLGGSASSIGRNLLG